MEHYRIFVMCNNCGHLQQLATSKTAPIIAPTTEDTKDPLVTLFGAVPEVSGPLPVGPFVDAPPGSVGVAGVGAVAMGESAGVSTGAEVSVEQHVGDTSVDTEAHSRTERNDCKKEH